MERREVIVEQFTKQTRQKFFVRDSFCIETFGKRQRHRTEKPPQKNCFNNAHSFDLLLRKVSITRIFQPLEKKHEYGTIAMS
jgi:hypothetical protein